MPREASGTPNLRFPKNPKTPQSSGVFKDLNTPAKNRFIHPSIGGSNRGFLGLVANIRPSNLGNLTRGATFEDLTDGPKSEGNSRGRTGGQTAQRQRDLWEVGCDIPNPEISMEHLEKK